MRRVLIGTESRTQTQAIAFEKQIQRKKPIKRGKDAKQVFSYLDFHSPAVKILERENGC